MEDKWQPPSDESQDEKDIHEEADKRDNDSSVIGSPYKSSQVTTKTLQCSSCGQTFNRKRSLCRHKKVHHKKK